MQKRSPHRLKGKIIRIRSGLALYQTYASPFYFARILDARNQGYKQINAKSLILVGDHGLEPWTR